MNKISSLLAQLTSVETEIAELNNLESKAGADLLLVASPGISVTTARAKILDARLTIDLTNAKKNNAFPLRDKISAELKETLNHLANHWNGWCKQLREATVEDIIAANVKFFNGDERAARRWWEQGPLSQQPVFTKFHNATYDLTSLRSAPNWDEIKMANHFLRHVKRHAAVLGIKPEELE